MPDSEPPSIALDVQRIADTIAQLERRIQERFPDAGLRNVARDLYRIAGSANERTAWLRRPIYPLRIATAVLVVGVLVPVVVMPFFTERWGSVLGKFSDYVGFLEPILGSMFFIGAIILFLISIESRIKPSEIPAAARASASMRWCVVLAGWMTRDLASPTLAR